MSEMFSHKVLTSRRTYFFDVKETREGSKYLVIGELTQVGNEHERHRVMVFEESLELFLEGVDKAADFILYGDDGDSEGDRRRGQGQLEQGAAGDMEETGRTLERIEQKIDEIRRHFK
ncbi:MAG: DUF3276 family protein [Blastocatellia bacterium]